MFFKLVGFIKSHKRIILSELFVYVACLIVFFAPVALASVISVENVIKLVNEARIATNTHVLRENEMLKKAAEQKAQDMIAKDYFAHVSPEEKTPWYWIKQSGYDYKLAGENLAVNFTNAEDEHEAWMDSELHKKNILNPDYDEIGVAVKEGILNGKKTILVVQMFGKPANPISGEKENGSGVAGAQSVGNKVAGISEIPKEKKSLSDLFNENKRALTGWSLAFLLAIIFIIIDIVALAHKKHKPILIYQ